MPSNRCQAVVCDPETKRLRLCKRNKKDGCGTWCYHHHYHIVYPHTINCQSIYRGNFTRRKLKIFYRLPTDLQRLVIYYINEQIYVRHFNSTISNTLDRKIRGFYTDIDYLEFMNDTVGGHNTFLTQPRLNSSKADEFVIQLFYILRLLKKYTNNFEGGVINKNTHKEGFLKMYHFCYYTWLEPQASNYPKDSLEYKLMAKFGNYVYDNFKGYGNNVLCGSNIYIIKPGCELGPVATQAKAQRVREAVQSEMAELVKQARYSTLTTNCGLMDGQCCCQICLRTLESMKEQIAEA